VFLASSKVKNDASSWRFVSVNGSSYDEFKLEFTNELKNVVAAWDGPTVIGSDFNLIRKIKEPLKYGDKTLELSLMLVALP
jgi:hypothetical protein